MASGVLQSKKMKLLSAYLSQACLYVCCWCAVSFDKLDQVYGKTVCKHSCEKAYKKNNYTIDTKSFTYRANSFIELKGRRYLMTTDTIPEIQLTHCTSR